MLGLIPGGSRALPAALGPVGRCPVRRGRGRQPGRCLPGDNGFFCLAEQSVASSGEGPSVGALSVRAEAPRGSLCSRCSWQARQDRRAPGPGCCRGRSPPAPRAPLPPGDGEPGPRLSPRWHLQLAHGFVVFGFRLRDFNQPALLLGGRKSELYFSHWPEQKTEASAGVWEWFMG